MVVQQLEPIRLWGKENPGRKVSAIMGGARRATRAARDGRWRLGLPPLPAGGPHSIEITGSRRIVVRDILVGEVWVASGQSNMHMNLMSTAEGRSAIPKANLPRLRLFTAESWESPEPRESTRGRWTLCTPESAQTFSAVAFHFGKRINRALKTPVGLIHSSWPGTAAEFWVPADEYRRTPRLRQVLRSWERKPAAEKKMLDGPWSFSVEIGAAWLLPKDSARRAVPLPLRTAPPGPHWRTVGTAQSARLVRPAGNLKLTGRLFPANHLWAEALLRADGKPANLSPYAGIGLKLRGTCPVAVATEQPTVTDWDRYFAQPVPLTREWKTIAIRFDRLAQAGWGVKKDFTQRAITGVMVVPMRPVGGPSVPGGLYNGMIAPLTRFPVKGALWYQGSSNVGRPPDYRLLLRALARGWRRVWKASRFPFLIVQLPNYLARRAEPGPSPWARLREDQMKAAREIPDGGLAVTIDVGEGPNIHPRHKRPVGERLAAWALGKVYRRPVVPSGPLFKSVSRTGSALRLEFENVGRKLLARGGGKLRGFAVAAKDRKFVWAGARIHGDTVIVASPQVKRPVAARYAWASNPDCNLINSARLPASPFRTDNWPDA